MEDGLKEAVLQLIINEGERRFEYVLELYKKEMHHEFDEKSKETVHDFWRAGFNTAVQLLGVTYRVLEGKKP